MGITIPVVKVADTKGRAGLTQSDHPDPNKRVTAPGANLLDPEEGIAELVNAGFPLDTVGLMNSMFAQFDDACGTAKKGGNPLRGRSMMMSPGEETAAGRGE